MHEYTHPFRISSHAWFLTTDRPYSVLAEAEETVEHLPLWTVDVENKFKFYKF
jgi:hypothetical protein